MSSCERRISNRSARAQLPSWVGVVNGRGDDKDGTAIRVAPEPRIRQVPPQAPAAAAAIEDSRRKKDQEDTPAVQTSANARGGWCEQEAQAQGKCSGVHYDASARMKRSYKGKTHGWP